MSRCVRADHVFALFLCAVVLAASWMPVAAQDDNTTTRRRQRNDTEQPARSPQQQPPTIRDTVQRPPDAEAPLRDTLARSGPIDTAITYYARDSVSYSMSGRMMRLVGDARVTYGDQQLEAAVIEIYFETSTMVAMSARDSTGRIIGVPKFTDKGDTFYGERLTYNFKTRRGTVTLGESVADDGFYFGKKIKRVDSQTLFIEDGSFTTCNLPHPHYFFHSPTMKVVANERVYVDPLIMYVEDLPVFAYPFGLFLENERGRRSGLIIPTFFFSGAPGSFNRGIVFENLGYYWAVSDYFDTQFLLDISTKGGFTIDNISKYIVRDVLNSRVNLAYGRTRSSTEDDYVNNWNIDVQHSHTLTPYTRVSGNVRFTSQDFNRQTSTDLRERIQQSILSNASLQHTFDNGSFFALSYSRDQNIITNALTEVLPSVSYSLPSLYPLRDFVDDDSWLQDISFSYSAIGTRTLRRPADNDTVNERDVSMRINHSPSLTIAPKLGYFTISPQISYRESWYFRRQTLTPDPADSSIDRTFEDGFFREYQYDLGLSVSTRLYGIANPQIFGVNAIRHTFQPTVSYVFTPDFSEPSYGFYGSYIDPVTNLLVKYPRFGADGGGVNNRLQQSIRFALANNIEAKIAAPVDTLPDQTVQLLNFDISGGYNIAADSLAWAPISVNARTSAAGVLSLSGNATFDLYDQDRVVRYTSTGDSLISYSVVDRLLASTGRGLARLTRASLSLQTAFSSQGVTSSIPDAPPPGLPDSMDYGTRFAQREDTSYAPDDLFGDTSPGYSPLSIPWNISLFFNFSYSEPTPIAISRTAALGASFGLNLTPTWHIRSSFNYDFITKDIHIPTVEITKDLHCWEFAMTWIPTGFSRGFFMRLNVKSPTLRDVKIEKRENVLYN